MTLIKIKIIAFTKHIPKKYSLPAVVTMRRSLKLECTESPSAIEPLPSTPLIEKGRQRTCTPDRLRIFKRLAGIQWHIGLLDARSLVVKRKVKGMWLISDFITHASHRLCADRMPGVARYVTRFAVLAGVYYLVARLSLHFAFSPGIVSPFWPPSAIALCACLAWGIRMAPAVWIGAVLAISSAGLPALSASIIGLGCALEASAAAFLVQRLYHPLSDFIYTENAFRFAGIALLSSLIGASFAAVGLAFAYRPATTALAVEWLTWWLGDASGIIVVVPLLFAWNITRGIKWHAAKIAEAIAFAILLPTITQIAFGGWLGHWPVAFLSIPFFLWAAFRFNVSAVAWTTALICAIAVWNTAKGNGPFAGADLNTSLLLLMIYLSVVGTMGLGLAGAVYHRNRVERTLKDERDSVERHVRNRTNALMTNIDERLRIEQRLATRERQLAEAQHLAQIGSWNLDLESGAITWSDELYRIYGVKKKTFALTPENCRMLIHPEDIDMLAHAVGQSRATGAHFHVEHRIVRPDGTTRTVAARGRGSKDESGRITRMFGTVQDITEAKIAAASLHEAEVRYRMVVELSPDAILVQQDDVFVFANHAALALLGADSTKQIAGRSLVQFLSAEYHQSARERVACLQRGETPGAVEQKLVRLDGRMVDVEINLSSFLHHGKCAALFIMRDITERKKTVEQMAYLAHYDSLTGLPNRALFRQRLEHALTIAERPGRSLEILFLDLDRFKNINDTLGHATGDLVLKETATRLQSILRESDTVARLGGDEFVVLVENVDEPHRGGIIAEKILAAFIPPFTKDKEPLTITTSIGISSFPSDGTDADTLLKNADIAMYRAKEMGRNSYRYYSPEMNLHTTERLALEYALSHAIELDQLSIYYQPKVDVATNRITGMEALLRWQHPTMGWIAPHQFIPVAEETGMIKPIGYWAIRTACLQNQQWQDTSPARLKVAANLSPRQLSDDKLLENIREILNDTELEPRYLELEITESAIMSNPEKSLLVLHALREMGVSVAIDSFGIGYSSFAYLKQFPIRAVKIDRSFVQGLPFNRGDSAITKAIINLAHSLECSVIAEGAETQQQYEFLRENDCDSVQGFYFSEPMSAEHFTDLIKVQSNLHLH
jgi:diguanylate cyclase (GGDEF)-like protein/PAS domain S-box-containing protein